MGRRLPRALPTSCSINSTLRCAVWGRWTLGWATIRSSRPLSCRKPRIWRRRWNGCWYTEGFNASRVNLTSRKEFHDFINTIASGDGRQVQQRTVFGLFHDAPHAWQFARLRAGAHAQLTFGNYDRAPFLLG